VTLKGDLTCCENCATTGTSDMLRTAVSQVELGQRLDNISERHLAIPVGEAESLSSPNNNALRIPNGMTRSIEAGRSSDTGWSNVVIELHGEEHCCLGERCIEKLKYQRSDSGIDSPIGFLDFDSQLGGRMRLIGRKGLARMSEVIADAGREGQLDFGFWIRGGVSHGGRGGERKRVDGRWRIDDGPSGATMKRAHKARRWRGLNLLGFALMVVRPCLALVRKGQA
jgi:hypothetical protein